MKSSVADFAHSDLYKPNFAQMTIIHLRAIPAKFITPGGGGGGGGGGVGQHFKEILMGVECPW